MNQRFTDQQLAGSVRFQRKITITAPEIEGSPLTGYVFGFDDETIFLALPTEPTIRKVMVHRRNGYDGIELHSESTMNSEPPQVRAQLQGLIRKFREKILEEYFPDRVSPQ